MFTLGMGPIHINESLPEIIIIPKKKKKTEIQVQLILPVLYVIMIHEYLLSVCICSRASDELYHILYCKQIS